MSDQRGCLSSGTPVFAELCALLALVLDVDATSIQAHTRLDDLRNWSSLTFIVVQLGIEKRFGFKLQPEQALTARDIGGVAALIARHRDAGG